MQGVAFEPVRHDSRSLFNRSCGVCICILYIYVFCPVVSRLDFYEYL